MSPDLIASTEATPNRTAASPATRPSSALCRRAMSRTLRTGVVTLMPSCSVSASGNNVLRSTSMPGRRRIAPTGPTQTVIGTMTCARAPVRPSRSVTPRTCRAAHPPRAAPAGMISTAARMRTMGSVGSVPIQPWTPRSNGVQSRPRSSSPPTPACSQSVVLRGWATSSERRAGRNRGALRTPRAWSPTGPPWRTGVTSVDQLAHGDPAPRLPPHLFPRSFATFGATRRAKRRRVPRERRERS